MFSYFSPLSPWTQMNSSSTLDVLFMYLSSYFFLCLEVHLGTFKDSLVSLIKLTSNSSLFCYSVIFLERGVDSFCHLNQATSLWSRTNFVEDVSPFLKHSLSY